MPDPADLTLAEAATALATGELTAGELLDACLRRADATAELGAFTERCDERAREEAEARDAERGGGRVADALHGIPVGIKDLADVAGMATRAGAAATDDAPAAADAPIVARLRAVGTVVMGKTATHEFAYGVTTRAVRNPWGDDRLVGGSSGGSAVAVAVGACPLALGSDTAGSCRIPAALCGVAGMMARPGTLDTSGVVPLAPGLDTLGLLARTAEDLALAWTALTGTAIAPPGDLVAATAPAERSGEADDAALAPPAPLTVATPPPEALGDVDDAALAAAERAAAALASQSGGRAVRAFDIPAFDDFSRPRGTLIAALALREHRARGWWPDRAERYGEVVAGLMRAAEEGDAAAVHAAHARLVDLGRRLRDAMSSVDVLVLPTTPTAAPPRDDDGDEPLRRSERRHAAELTRLCGPVNIAGLAAVSVFGVLDGAGLPLGVQIVARDEATALGAAVACERLIGPPPRPPLREDRATPPTDRAPAAQGRDPDEPAAPIDPDSRAPGRDQTEPPAPREPAAAAHHRPGEQP